MNAVPHIKFPALEDVLSYVDADKFPCAEEARSILLAETSLGNVVQAVGDAGCMPDETVVVIDFAQDTKQAYPQSEIKSWSGNMAYRCLKFLDKHNGALYVRFFFEKGDGEDDKRN